MRTYCCVVLLAIAIAASPPGFSRAAAQSTCPASFAQFTCPAIPSDVVIAHPMCLEANCTLHQVRVERGGELLVPDETRKADAKKINISATAIFVKDGGVFQVGPLANNRLTLIFTGPRPVQVVVDPDGPDDPCPSAHFDKGIEVCRGGTLNLLGTKGVPALGGTPWTYLSAPAGDPAKYGAINMQPGHTPTPTKVAAPVTQPDAQTIQITADVSADWQPGDWIVIGTTNFSPLETEFVQIKTIVGTTITLNQPLKYYHFGSLAPDSGLSATSATCKDTSGRVVPAALCAGSDNNYGVDERAEVELISRNIILTSDAGQAGPEHWGGEIKIRAQFAQVLVQGVQLENLGPSAATALIEVEKLNAQSRARPLAAPIVRPSYASAKPDRMPEGAGPLLRMPGARLRDSYRKTRR
jgi:G8 domain